MKYEIGDEVRVCFDWHEYRWGWGLIERSSIDADGNVVWMVNFRTQARPVPIVEEYLVGRPPLELLARAAE